MILIWENYQVVNSRSSRGPDKNASLLVGGMVQHEKWKGESACLSSLIVGLQLLPPANLLYPFQQPI